MGEKDCIDGSTGGNGGQNDDSSIQKDDYCAQKDENGVLCSFNPKSALENLFRL